MAKSPSTLTITQALDSRQCFDIFVNIARMVADKKKTNRKELLMQTLVCIFEAVCVI